MAVQGKVLLKITTLPSNSQQWRSYAARQPPNKLIAVFASGCLHRWLSPTNISLKHKFLASKYMFVWLCLSSSMFECSCLFGQLALGHCASFLLISHFIWPVPTVKLLSRIIHMFFSALRGVNGSS
jgi:hypothetical protein